MTQLAHAGCARLDGQVALRVVSACVVKHPSYCDLTSQCCIEAAASSAAISGTDRDVLARGKCLQALAALRHTKWFQVRVINNTY